MIHEPIFEDPNSLISLLQRAQATWAAGDRIPDTDLATIIELHSGKALPDAITEYLTQHFRGQIRGRKGPKLQSDLVKEFRFGPAANLYDHYLPVFEYLAQRRKRPACKRYNANTGSGYRDGSLTPGERTLEYVLEKRPDPDDLGNISRKSLANAISQWRQKVENRDFRDENPNAHCLDGPSSDLDSNDGI